MQQLNRFFLLFFLTFVTFSFAQSNASDTTKILFIGNSYTYYNSSPELLGAMVKEKFPNQAIKVQLVSQGGMTLQRHWQEGKALKMIKSDDWDYVVLQEQSKLGMVLVIDSDTYFGQTAQFFKYARKFDAEIKDAGSKTVFLMTWSTKDRPKEQEILSYAYTAIAKELNAIIAPVGLVWDQVRSSDQFNLYDFDGSHPSPYGSFLSMTTLYATLFKDNPLGLSGKISGLSLSSEGVPSSEPKVLTSISTVDAQIIQKASWSVVKHLEKEGGYMDVKQPAKSYTLPVLPKGDPMGTKNLEGRWYGTSAYGSNYLGLILDAVYKGNQLNIALSFYAPDKQDHMAVQDVSIEDDQLQLTFMDSLRSLNSQLKFSFSNGEMKGISKSSNDIMTQYKHWDLSRDHNQNGIDLTALDLLMQSFQSDIEKRGYVAAAIDHYKRYSELIGSHFIPEEMYLNAVGYNYLQDGNINDALDVFELAMTLYPSSVNTYDSFGEALIQAGQREKALKVYTEGYLLAKKTGDKNLSYIEANLKRLKENKQLDTRPDLPPPPPVPQPQ